MLPQPTTPSTLPVISTPRSGSSPLPGLGRSVRLRNLARQRQHQGDGVLGGRDRIAERRVHHDDALGRGGGNLDVVDADAGAADHLEVGGLLEDLRGRLVAERIARPS